MPELSEAGRAVRRELRRALEDGNLRLAEDLRRELEIVEPQHVDGRRHGDDVAESIELVEAVNAALTALERFPLALVAVNPRHQMVIEARRRQLGFHVAGLFNDIADPDGFWSEPEP